jgi:chemotaxis protein CheZ
MSKSNDPQVAEVWPMLVAQWQAQWGDQQAQWLASYDYLFEQSQDVANRVLTACEQLQQSLDPSAEQDHQALQLIMQAQAFADLHGQILQRMTHQLQAQHLQMQAWFGDYEVAEVSDAQLQQGIGPASSARGKQEGVASQQEADDLLAQLGL